MATTYQQFVDAVIDLAASTSPGALQDAEMVVESLLPITMQDVAEKYAGDERRRQLLKAEFSLSVVNGFADINPAILTSAMDDSRLFDPATPQNLYAFTRNYASLSYGLNPLLGYYSLEFGDRLRVVPPGTLFSPNSGATVTLTLVVAAVPAIPTTAAGFFTFADEYGSDLIEATAKALQSLTVQGAPQAA